MLHEYKGSPLIYPLYQRSLSHFLKIKIIRLDNNKILSIITATTYDYCNGAHYMKLFWTELIEKIFWPRRRLVLASWRTQPMEA